MPPTVLRQGRMICPFIQNSNCQKLISSRCSRKGILVLGKRVQNSHTAHQCRATATENASEDLPAELKKLVTNFSMVCLLFCYAILRTAELQEFLQKISESPPFSHGLTSNMEKTTVFVRNGNDYLIMNCIILQGSVKGAKAFY